MPRGVRKEVRELIDGVIDTGGARGELKAAEAAADYAVMSEKQVAKEIKRLEKAMFDYAKNLEFEKAARTRDQLAVLREKVFGAGGAGNVTSLVPAERAA